MQTVSRGMLKLLAALFWLTGGTVLSVKGASLLLEAGTIHPDRLGPWIAMFCGVFLGCIKARYWFSRIAKKNVLRIENLSTPRPWQFYRLRFFVSLIGMVILGSSLSWVAYGNYPMLLAVGMLDLTIAFALLGSSYIFWLRREW